MIDNTTLSSRDHLPREKAPHLAKDNEFRTEFPTPSRSPSPVNDGKEETKAESVERRVSPDLVSIKVEEQELTLSKDQASEAPEEIGEGVGDNDVKVNASKSPVNDEKEETKAESAGQGDSSDLVSIKVEEQELTLSKDQASEAPEEIGEGVGDNDAKVNASKSPVDDEKEETKAESVGQGGSPDLVSIKVEQQELTLPKDQASEAPEEIGEGVGDNDAKVNASKVNASKVPLLTPSPTPSRSSSPAPKVEPESESHIKKEAEAIKNAQEETKELTETKKASITSKTNAKGDSEKAKAISERQAEDEPIRQVKKVEDIEAVAKAIVKAKIQAERNATVPSLVSPGDVGYGGGRTCQFLLRGSECGIPSPPHLLFPATSKYYCCRHISFSDYPDIYPRFQCLSLTKLKKRCSISQYKVICIKQDAAAFRCSHHDGIWGKAYSPQYPHIPGEYRHMRPYPAPVKQTVSSDITFVLHGRTHIVFSSTKFDELTEGIKDAHSKTRLHTIITEYFSTLARTPMVTRYNYKFEEEVKRYLGKGMVYYLLVRPLTQDGLFIHREKAKALNDGVVIKSGYTTRGQKRLDEHEELCGIKPSPCEKFPRAGSVIFAHLLERILQDLWFEKQVDMQCENVGRCNDKHRERYCLSRKVNESLVLAFNRNLDELRPVAMQWVNAIKSLDQVRNLLIDEHNKRRKGYYPDIEL